MARVPWMGLDGPSAVDGVGFDDPSAVDGA